MTHSCPEVLELNYSSVRPGAPSPPPPPPSPSKADAGRGAGLGGAGSCTQLCLCSWGQQEEGNGGVQWGVPHPGPTSFNPQQCGYHVLVLGVTVLGWGCPSLAVTPSSPALGAHWVPAPAAPCSQQLQQLKIRCRQQGSPVCGKPWAGGWACGAILRGLRDYSWPVNIDSASSGATAQPGSTEFRARREARRAAELGALSRGGRGQGEDVSSVICSERLLAAGWEKGTPQACRRLRGGQRDPLGCTEHLPLRMEGLGQNTHRQFLAGMGGVCGAWGGEAAGHRAAVDSATEGQGAQRTIWGLQVAKQVSSSSLFPCLFEAPWGGPGQPGAGWLQPNGPACT